MVTPTQPLVRVNDATHSFQLLTQDQTSFRLLTRNQNAVWSLCDEQKREQTSWATLLGRKGVTAARMWTWAAWFDANVAKHPWIQCYADAFESLRAFVRSIEHQPASSPSSKSKPVKRARTHHEKEREKGHETEKEKEEEGEKEETEEEEEAPLRKRTARRRTHSLNLLTNV